MDTKSLLAIVFMVIAIVILLSLTIYTVVKSWMQISREYEQRQRSSMQDTHSFGNTECDNNEPAAPNDTFTLGEKSSEYAQVTSDYYQTADSNQNEYGGIKSSKSAVKQFLFKLRQAMTPAFKERSELHFDVELAWFSRESVNR